MAVGHVQVNHAVPECTSPSGTKAKAVYRAWDWYNTLGFVADQTCLVHLSSLVVSKDQVHLFASLYFFFSINIVLWTVSKVLSHCGILILLHPCYLHR